MSPELHQHRKMAESFGSDPERYDRSRTRYPDAMVERIVAASPGLDVLDVGCGTGIDARQFAAAGCRVLGVEPDARMAESARQGGPAVEVATFEDWDPAGRAFDTVIAGQSWHWHQAAIPGANTALSASPPVQQGPPDPTAAAPQGSRSASRTILLRERHGCW